VVANPGGFWHERRAKSLKIRDSGRKAAIKTSRCCIARQRPRADRQDSRHAFFEKIENRIPFFTLFLNEVDVSTAVLLESNSQMNPGDLMRKYLASVLAVAFGVAPVGAVVADNTPFPVPPHFTDNTPFPVPPHFTDNTPFPVPPHLTDNTPFPVPPHVTELVRVA
jgi:hypothetical protein